MERLRKSLGSFLDDDDVACYVSSGNIRIWNPQPQDEDKFVNDAKGNGVYVSYISWIVVFILMALGSVKIVTHFMLNRSRYSSKEKQHYPASTLYLFLIRQLRRIRLWKDQTLHSYSQDDQSSRFRNLASYGLFKQEADASISVLIEAQARTIDNNISPPKFAVPNNICDETSFAPPASSLSSISDESDLQVSKNSSFNLAANKPESLSPTHWSSQELQDALAEASKAAQTIQLAQVVFERHGVDRSIASMWALRHQESQKRIQDDHRKEMDRRLWDVMQRNTEHHVSQIRHEETISALRHDPNLMEKVQEARAKCFDALLAYCLCYIPLSTFLVVGTKHPTVQFILKLLSSEAPFHKKALIIFDSVRVCSFSSQCLVRVPFLILLQMQLFKLCGCSGSFSFIDDFPFSVKEQCQSWLFCGGVLKNLASSSALLKGYGSCLLWIISFFGLHRVLRLLSMPPPIFHAINVAPLLFFWWPELINVPLDLLVWCLGLQLAFSAWVGWAVNSCRGTTCKIIGIWSNASDLQRALVKYNNWDRRIRLFPIASVAIAVVISMNFL
jgi:hypothetical protein